MMAKIIINKGDVLTRVEIYRRLSSLFLTKQLPRDLVYEYLYESEEEKDDILFQMQDFIAENLKETLGFSISIPILDCIELLIQENEQNGNIEILEDNEQTETA